VIHVGDLDVELLDGGDVIHVGVVKVPAAVASAAVAPAAVVQRGSSSRHSSGSGSGSGSGVSDDKLIALVTSVDEGIARLEGVCQWIDDSKSVRTDERLSKLEAKVQNMDAKLDEVLHALRGTSRPASGSSGE
jgi:hypothetical protein